jgi:iron(II)-dependent oxidoreductase
LRHLRGRAPILADGDALYDSASVAHETRWDLPLPSKAETLTYMHNVLDQVLDDYVLTRAHSSVIRSIDDPAYFLSLVLFHEDMHAEAITYTRQTLGYPAPQLTVVDRTQGTRTEDLVSQPPRK